MSIERTEFDSGLRVVTERMPGVRSVALGIWVGIGSRDEDPQVAGASHFLEHLLFKGTKKRSAQDIAEAFDAVGGDLNAFTAKENTCYYARVRDRDLAMTIESLCDMVTATIFKSVDFEAERQVILEEIHMRDDAPEDLVHDVFNESIWPDHPLGRPVLGTQQTIKDMSMQQVQRFWKKHYTPSNFVVAVAGNVQHDEVVKLVRKHLPAGRIKRGTKPHAPLYAGDLPIASGRTQVLRRDSEQAHIVLGMNGLSRTDDDRFALSLVNTALGGGMSARLFQEIREKRGLAYSVYSYHQMFAEAGLFAVYAGTTPSKAHEVLALMREQVADVAAHGITAEELARAKGQSEGSMVLGLEETSNRMSRIGKVEQAGGEPLTLNAALKKIDAVTLEDCKRVAARVLGQPASLTVLGPFDAREFDAPRAKKPRAVSRSPKTGSPKRKAARRPSSSKVAR